MIDYLIISNQNSLVHELYSALANDRVEYVSDNISCYEIKKKCSSSTVVLLDAGIKWTCCKTILQKLYEIGCFIIFLTYENNMEHHLTAVYHGESVVLKLPVHCDELEKTIHYLASKKNNDSTLQLIEDEKIAVLNGKKIELTAQEYALLNALMVEGNPPVSREELLRTAWGYQSIGETRTVDVHVQRLRKKLGVDLIETVYRCGYRLNLV